LVICPTDGQYGSVTNQCLTLVSSPMWIDFSDEADLFPHTRDQSHECDAWHYWDGSCDTSQVSGACYVVFASITVLTTMVLSFWSLS
jgi:hypothetical protein